MYPSVPLRLYAKTLPGKLRAERFAGMLTTAINVQNDTPHDVPLCHSFGYVNTQILLHVVIHLQHENLAALAVINREDVQLAVPELYLDDVCQQLHEKLNREEKSCFIMFSDSSAVWFAFFSQTPIYNVVIQPQTAYLVKGKGCECTASVVSLNQ